MPIMQSIIRDTALIRPLFESLSSTIMGDVNGNPSVIMLCIYTSPAKISRLVTQVIVDTVKAMSVRTWPKMSLKILHESEKVVYPIRVNGNPSPSVVSVGTIFRVETPRFNVNPIMILPVFSSGWGDLALKEGFPFHTPTGFSPSALGDTEDVRFSNLLLCTACGTQAFTPEIVSFSLPLEEGVKYH